jgi:atypical dual specificity phosphatase
MVKYHIQIGPVRVQPFCPFCQRLGKFSADDSIRAGGDDTRMFDLLKARLLFVPTLLWNVLLGRLLRRRHWWDEIEPNVLLGALPFVSDVHNLAKAGVTAVVNTCEEAAGPESAYQKFGIRQFRIPTIDFTHPKLADVENAVKFIEVELAKGGKVYVHCKAGRGRSATVVLCWLLAARGMSRQQAQLHLNQCRPHVNPRIAERPVVIEFEKRRRAGIGKLQGLPPNQTP